MKTKSKKACQNHKEHQQDHDDFPPVWQRWLVWIRNKLAILIGACMWRLLGSSSCPAVAAAVTRCSYHARLEDSIVPVHVGGASDASDLHQLCWSLRALAYHCLLSARAGGVDVLARSWLIARAAAHWPDDHAGAAQREQSPHGYWRAGSAGCTDSWLHQ